MLEASSVVSDESPEKSMLAMLVFEMSANTIAVLKLTSRVVIAVVLLHVRDCRPEHIDRSTEASVVLSPKLSVASVAVDGNVREVSGFPSQLISATIVLEEASNEVNELSEQ